MGGCGLRYLIPILVLISLAVACGGGDSRAVVAIGDVGGLGEFEVSSLAFQGGGRIPPRYTCDGEDRSFPLEWSGAPEETQSYAIVLDDPDAPGGTFKHWMIFDIPRSDTGLRESVDKTEVIVGGAVQLRNDFGRTGYSGPCPPEGEAHRYQVFVFALSEPVALGSSASQTEVLDAIAAVALARASLEGVYGR